MSGPKGGSPDSFTIQLKKGGSSVEIQGIEKHEFHRIVSPFLYLVLSSLCIWHQSAEPS